eukprot:5250190-Pyramimonas_sp.AAC.1
MPSQSANIVASVASDHARSTLGHPTQSPTSEARSFQGPFKGRSKFQQARQASAPSAPAASGPSPSAVTRDQVVANITA